MTVFNQEFLREALTLPVGVEIGVSKEKTIQSLWAGYGSVSSFTINDLSGGRSYKVVVKRVRPPPQARPSVSHLRKVKSYQVEASFYSSKNKGASCLTGQCAVPKVYSVEVQEEEEENKKGKSSTPSFTFLLSDLRTEFPDVYPEMDEMRTKVALQWLSSFHATFWEKGANDNGKQWECGGYWHLETRQEELDNMSREWALLKRCSSAINKRIRERKHQTLCHGDFKSANLLFHENGSKCAAVDFQYVGGGYGMKDVVMLLISSAELEMSEWEEDLLKFYHSAVRHELEKHGAPRKTIQSYTLEIAKMHYELCLLDYVRFMAGWGMWGSNCDYAERRTHQVLNDLSKNFLPRGKATNPLIEQAIYSKFPLD